MVLLGAAFGRKIGVYYPDRGVNFKKIFIVFILSFFC